MAASQKDPTASMRKQAGSYAGVDEGTACTQSAFKAGKKAFLYVGLAAGRHKAMFKLQASMADAKALAKKDPARFEVGSTGWVTARFTADKPMPKTLWRAWLDESYALAVGEARPAARKATKKKAATKPGAKKRTRKTQGKSRRR